MDERLVSDKNRDPRICIVNKDIFSAAHADFKAARARCLLAYKPLMVELERKNDLVMIAKKKVLLDALLIWIAMLLLLDDDSKFKTKIIEARKHFIFTCAGGGEKKHG